MDVLDAIDELQDERLKGRCIRAIHIIERTLDLYGPRGVAFSFNGGKDSTVLLHLLRAAVVEWQRRHPGPDSGGGSGGGGAEPPAPSSSGSRGLGTGGAQLQYDDPQLAIGLGGITTFFFHDDRDFPEITEFTHRVNAEYGLGMETLYGDFKAGLASLLERSSVHAIILGTRKGDPNAGDQDTFCPSSVGWPAFMRVNPILDWTYHDIWAFLRMLQAPYCSLYDQGYTSIGSVDNTVPNRALVKEDGSFAPAHLLPDARLERAGRAGNKPRRVDTLGADARTAALIIIGDEILSAKVEEVNTRFLCAELRAIGWQVCKAVVLRDDVCAIAAEVKALSECHDVVITSGGLGPTLDDVTMQAVAAAFERSLERHPELEARLRAYFGADITESHLKMAEAPSGSEVSLIEEHRGEVSPFPLLRCRNVFVLPGIPDLLRRKWQAARQQLIEEAGRQPAFHTVVLRLGIADETQVATALEEVAAAVGSEVAVGSYPVSNQSDGAELVLSLESKNGGRLEDARQLLLRRLPQRALLGEQRDVDELSSPLGQDGQVGGPFAP